MSNTCGRSPCQVLRGDGGCGPRPIDVHIVAGLGFLAAMSHFVLVWFKRGQGEVFLGGLWISSEYWRITSHLAMALYSAVWAVGLERLRPFGYWMLVFQVGVAAAATLAWWEWGRHVGLPATAAPPGAVWLVIRLGWVALLAAWCVWRRRLFRGARRAAHKSRP